MTQQEHFPGLDVVTLLKCADCERVIQSPGEGFIVHGNIYAADAESISGLIGDHFPQDPVLQPQLSTDSSSALFASDAFRQAVQAKAYCTSCFAKILGLRLTATR